MTRPWYRARAMRRINEEAIRRRQAAERERRAPRCPHCGVRIGPDPLQAAAPDYSVN